MWIIFLNGSWSAESLTRAAQFALSKIDFYGRALHEGTIVLKLGTKKVFTAKRPRKEERRIRSGELDDFEPLHCLWGINQSIHATFGL